MQPQQADSHGCDSLDMAPLWPCSAQLGAIPVSDLISQRPALEEPEETKVTQDGIW